MAVYKCLSVDLMEDILLISMEVHKQEPVEIRGFTNEKDNIMKYVAEEG